MRAAQVELDGVGDVAQVRYQAHFDALRAKTEAHRIDGVVRDGKAIDFDIAHAERGARLETIQPRRELAPGNGRRSQASDEDRYIEQPRQSHQAADVIGMLVRDQDGIQLFGVFIDQCQPGQNVAPAQPGVDKDARFFGTDESGISRATAGQNADLNYDKPPLSLAVAHALVRAAFTLV